MADLPQRHVDGAEADLGFVLLANGNDLTDEILLAQVGRDARALLFGLEPPGLSPGSDLLTRWSKHVLLALAAGQLGLAILTLPILFRVSRRERLRRADWVVLVSASMLDLSLIVSWAGWPGPRSRHH